MGHTVDDAALDTLFREARSYAKWQPRPVSDETLRDLYELVNRRPRSPIPDPRASPFLRRGDRKELLRRRRPRPTVESSLSVPGTRIAPFACMFTDGRP